MPQLGELVSQCSICGNDFYESEMVRHYKTGRLVDVACADEPGASDYLEKVQRPVEKRKAPRQPVPNSEDGYNAADWATISFAANFGTIVSVIGDSRAGILTIVGGTADEVAIFFTITFGTALASLPTTLTITPWSPTATEGVIISAGVSAVDISGAAGTIKKHVTYQWRYEVN